MRTFTLKELTPEYLIKSKCQIELPDKVISFKIKIVEYYFKQCEESPVKCLKVFSNLGRTQLHKYNKIKFLLTQEQEQELRRMILNPVLLKIVKTDGGRDIGDRLHISYMDLEDVGVTPMQVQILDVLEVSEARKKVNAEKNNRENNTPTDEGEIFNLAKDICSRAATGGESLVESCIAYNVNPETFKEWLYRYEDVRLMYGESVSIMEWIISNVGRSAVLQHLVRHITTGQRKTVSTRYKRKRMRTGGFGFVEDTKVETIEELEPDRLFSLYLNLRNESANAGRKLGVDYSALDMDKIEEMTIKALKEKGKI